MNRNLLLYCAKFIIAYCVLYYGSQAIIGISAPGGYYSAFVHKYLNYPALLRKAILRSTEFFLTVMGYNMEMVDEYKVRIAGGRGVRMVYSCLGIGVTSFWVAFMIANDTGLRKKLFFILFGSVFIFLINVARVMLLLITTNEGRPMPFGLEHHTFFTIVSYGFIILLIILFDISEKKSVFLGSKKQAAG